MTSTANLRQNSALNSAIPSLRAGTSHLRIDLFLFHCCFHADIVNNIEEILARTMLANGH